MVDASRLTIHNGELGPTCDYCGVGMTFGQSIPIDSKYSCFECYQEQTGITSSSTGTEVDGLPME